MCSLQVSELRLDLHVEFVCDLSIAASKELAIEEALTEIKQVWAVQELDMICEKGVRMCIYRPVFVSLKLFGNIFTDVGVLKT